MVGKKCRLRGATHEEAIDCKYPGQVERTLGNRLNLGGITMNATRFTGFAVCLGLACLMLTENALAGTTTTTEVTYAREVGKDDAIYTLLPANTAERAMNVIRSVSQDFTLRVSLSDNAQFATPTLPAAGDLTLTTTGGGAVTVSITDGGANDTFVLYLVDVTTAFTAFPTFTLTTTGWTIRDVDNVLGGGGTITLTLETRDSASNTIIDPGIGTKDWLKSAFGADVVSALSPTTAAIDFTTTFIDTPPDTTVRDNGATLGIDGSVADVLDLAGTAFTHW